MNNPMQMMQMLNQLKSNPAAMLSQRFNVPQNMMNDPNAIIQHLMNTGQVTQAQFNNVQEIARSMRGQF